MDEWGTQKAQGFCQYSNYTSACWLYAVHIKVT